MFQNLNIKKNNKNSTSKCKKVKVTNIIIIGKEKKIVTYVDTYVLFITKIISTKIKLIHWMVCNLKDVLQILKLQKYKNPLYCDYLRNCILRNDYC